MRLDYYLEKYAHILSSGSTVRSVALNPFTIGGAGLSAVGAEGGAGGKAKAFVKNYGKSVALGAFKGFSKNIAKAVGDGSNWKQGFSSAGNSFIGKN